MPGNWQHSSTLVEMQLLAGVQDSRKAPHFCTLARCGGRAHSREDDEPETNCIVAWRPSLLPTCCPAESAGGCVGKVHWTNQEKASNEVVDGC